MYIYKRNSGKLDFSICEPLYEESILILPQVDYEDNVYKAEGEALDKLRALPQRDRKHIWRELTKYLRDPECIKLYLETSLYGLVFTKSEFDVLQYFVILTDIKE